MYTYYLTQRPASIGCYPKGGVVMVENFDTKQQVEEIGRAAWAKVTYAEPLTDQDIYNYELTPSPKNQ